MFIKKKTKKKQQHWVITSDQLEQPSLISQQTVYVGEDVEKREPSFTNGGNVNWWKQYGNTLEN